ncbi:hypothetical protein PIB30_003684 [Stylosanthes scabra]|uniref:Uncharacterized protein n=1 Tax=Stylosanthes scabra TaxID=79078 RepID=A0ABU6Z1D6_9FABA|nr:hypothetical protein [Stylosanthes scabra]
MFNWRYFCQVWHCKVSSSRHWFVSISTFLEELEVVIMEETIAVFNFQFSIGLIQGVPYLPPKPKRRPETEIDQLQRSLGVQIQQLNMTTQNQFLLESKQHLVSAEAQAHDNLRYSAYHGGIDPRRVFGLSHGSWGATDDWYTRNDGLMYSHVQPGSVKHEFQPIGDIATLDNNVKRLKRSPKGSIYGFLALTFVKYFQETSIE